MNNPSADREMESIDTFCLMSPDGYHDESYESALLWENHSYHQRRADLLHFLAAELSFNRSQGSSVDRIGELHQSLDNLLEAAHKRHQALHERYVLDEKPPAPCDDDCALTYIEGQPIPTEDDLTRHSWEGLSREDHAKAFQERVLAIGHHRLQEVVRRIEEDEKLWDAYAKDLRSWHEERKNRSAKPEEIDLQDIEIEDLPF
jgi:hypothetical protein